ncbi:MAG TPA: alpha-glucan family phosphorylase [Gemmatimonadales bacterium]|nr:alpha-glucan family phosphorylase [Gemmatimonadales bacterium]HEV8598899.1 alpha-glucan family phosphorylase [Gemmatimonadales bacterium]
MAVKVTALPPRLEGLTALVTNLAWSWNREARQLLRSIDLPLWRRVRHNPIQLLREIPPARLEQLAHDPGFLHQYDLVMEWMAENQAPDRTWFARRYPKLLNRPVAYFCAEFGFHNSVPIYSGGLGVLAGDHCKSASDLGVPLVGVGLSYMKGYFDQRLRSDGWQEDSDDHVDPNLTPLVELTGSAGEAWLAVVETFGRPVHVRVWSMRVGRVPLYLLDTNLEVNHPEDRTLLNKLYGGGPDLRLRQEWLLGVGGVRVLRAVGLSPGVWHANEGHAAFMMLERVRELTAAGKSFAEALSEVRRTTVFTTHTPVPAGHDRFDLEQLVQCTGPIWEAMGASREAVLSLGRHPAEQDGGFQMTVMALHLAGRVNAVSERHATVSRAIWQPLWPERAPEEIPILPITNGVHLATWMANPMMAFLDNQLGSDWGSRLDDPTLWEQLRAVDPGALWATHVELKGTLLGFIREEARRRFAQEWTEANQVVAAGTLLHPYALTLGFARRFATYKRANLLFRDVDRLQRLLCDPRRPVQIIFAGKAHPADNPGKEVLQQIYRWTHNPFFEGRVAFLEDYDMHLAHALAEGVDLWVNLPRVPLEACGTSGMKAALNGVPQLGTIDGWWEEGYDGSNGWAIPKPSGTEEVEAQDASDAEHLYRLLEEDIVPLYYARDANGVPLGWVDRMRNAIRVAGARFTARRMVLEYTERFYLPAIRGERFTDDPPIR